MAQPLQIVTLLALVTLLASPLAGARPAIAQTERTVTASARCIDAGTGLQPEVEVTLTNETGAPLTVSYVHGFTTPQAFAVLMRMVDQGDMPTVVVPDGATRTIREHWDDLRQGPGFFGGALVVTSAGALIPTCGDRPVDADEIRLGPAPNSAEDARREAVAIAAETLGRLESWRAYPALYQLLHPDARAEVPFAAVACWYADQYGLPSAPLPRTVFATEVTDVGFGPWTWSVTGQTYPDAATVSYRQRVGTIVGTEEIAGVEHLVEADGQWRWFFGASREAIAAQPTDCDLAPSTPPTTGAIEVRFYDCQAGMTIETFDPTGCGPLAPGSASFVLTPGPDVDASALAGGPLFGFSTWTPLGDGRFLIGDLPFGTYHVGPGPNYPGPPFHAPGHGPPLGAAGPAASTFAVTIDEERRYAVIAFYRLGPGTG